MPLSRTHSCPTCLPPRARISHLRLMWTVPCAVGWSRPCCHPCGGHLRRAGRSPRPCGVRGHLVEEGGCLLMARSVCDAFGGCCRACTSWFPCVLLCVLLGLVSLPCVGRLCAQLLCCLRSSQFRALSSSVGTLTDAGVQRRGGSMSLPASHSGCRVVPLSVAPPPPFT